MWLCASQVALEPCAGSLGDIKGQPMCRARCVTVAAGTPVRDVALTG